MHAAFGEISFATAAVCIRQNARAVRHLVLELALITGTAGVQQRACALAAAIHEVALVLNAGGEKQSSFAFPASIAIFALVAVAVLRNVLALTRHLSFEPAAVLFAAAAVAVTTITTKIAGFKIAKVNCWGLGF
jgi:hypothetical protein